MLSETIEVLFFFQAEDGIRDYKVTGVQTCALPICADGDRVVRKEPQPARPRTRTARHEDAHRTSHAGPLVQSLSCACGEIGRASCRERETIATIGVS